LLDDANIDYLDTEVEEEVAPRNSSKLSRGAPEKRDEDASHESPSNSSARILEEEADDPTELDHLEENSSMEGSDKTFSFLNTSGEASSNASSEEASSILIGGAVVSVVTTKSVVNGTISVPTTVSPTTTEQIALPPPSPSFIETTAAPAPEVTTEDSSRILASVQTSRSISGARFLPFPVIDRVEQVEAHGGLLESKKTSQSPSESTESIIDKLDWAQSKLSSDLLPAAILGTGGFRNAGNTLQLDVLADRATTRRRFTTTAKTPVISKFVPRRYNDKRVDHINTSTAKPRFETTIDNLEALLPRDYALRGSAPSVGASKINFRLDMSYTN